MSKRIFITGSTDGIGLMAANELTQKGHEVILHGRSDAKIEKAKQEIGSNLDGFAADLGDFSQVRAMAQAIQAKYDRLDVLINNAGVLKLDNPLNADGLDLRFVVNTLSPYLLTRELQSIIPATGRVVNVASAAQQPVDIDAMQGKKPIDQMSAYSQSKMGLIIWTNEMAAKSQGEPEYVSLNPGSLLSTKMAKDAFGTVRNDASLGSDILQKAALDESFANANGKYYDTDNQRFAAPNSWALNETNSQSVMHAIEDLV